MKLISTHHHLLGGTLLIAGTSIGVGMLALPVVTAAGGFIPSLVIYGICWLFMVAIAMLILEACLWMPKETNLISISRKLLGKTGAGACWILYLFLFYCLLTAHIAAGGGVVSQFFEASMPTWLCVVIYVAAFAPVVYLGTRVVDRVNIALMVGLVVTYLFFIGFAAPHLQVDLLVRSDWPRIWAALPVVLTAFGFQNLIPTLVTYMERDHVKVRKAIWIGTGIPLVIYVVWGLLIQGIVPLEGQSGLLVAMKQGHSAVAPLQASLGNSAISTITAVFSFFAMTTSFVGIAIAFFDFWADGLSWEKKGAKRTGLLALVFGLPLASVLVDPTLFFKALELAGGLGMILLLGILPILFVWSGRYIHRFSPSHPFVKGGKGSLALLFGFCLLVLAIQFYLE